MPKKILLADDSLTIQKVVELTFSDSDFELVCVSNGQRALEKVREERPDLILADVVMPEKNGYEVCEAIKGNPATARIPVVLLSGTFEPFDRERAERIGADAIVSKPFDSHQLLSQVEALLARAPEQAPAPSLEATTVAIPMASMVLSPPTEPVAKPAEEPPPFEAGFTAEDFTGTFRVPAPAVSADPFEEEYGRAGVDSAIEAFEKVQPGPAFAAETEIEIDDRRLTGKSLVEEAGGVRPQWLAEEPEKTAPIPIVEPPPVQAPADTFDVWGPGDSGSRVEAPSLATAALRGPLMPAPVAEAPAEPEPTPSAQPAAQASGTAIPKLTQLLSTISRSNGDLSDADIERLAAKVVEKFSEKIVREIAWEVIPDMAEIVIKQRIKELESGIE
jgi:CheY-like chemotaxis protein